MLLVDGAIENLTSMLEHTATRQVLSKTSWCFPPIFVRGSLSWVRDWEKL
jgi:hypothetical protein